MKSVRKEDYPKLCSTENLHSCEEYSQQYLRKNRLCEIVERVFYHL